MSSAAVVIGALRIKIVCGNIVSLSVAEGEEYVPE